MTLSKFKKSKSFQAVRKFTDREEPRQVFQNSLQAVTKAEQPFKVLVYYGFGGIGKTTLLNELKMALKKEKPRSIHSLFISLDAFEFNAPTDILISLRNQIKVPAVLFDFAITKYWAAVGKSADDLKKRLHETNVVQDIFNVGSEFTGSLVPAGLVTKAISGLTDKYYATFSKYKEEIQTIKDSTPMEIHEMLPFFLGLAIEDAYERKGIIHVFYFDAYETMVKKLEEKAISQSPEEWIKEFIGSSERGLFILSSREYIKWGEENHEWVPHLEQHILGSLSDVDANLFLDSVPIIDENIKKEIIKSAKGIPLYLDLCVSIYETKKANKEEISPQDFAIAEHEVIQRFLRHLSKQEQELVKILSLMTYFDYEYFSYIIENFTIGYPKSLFNEFITKSIVSKIDEENHIYKLDESITAYINKNHNPGLVKDVTVNALTYLLNNADAYSDATILKYYGRIFTIQNQIEDIDVSYIEKLLKLSFYLIDRGNWVTVGKIVQRYQDQNQNSQIANAAKLTYAIYLRRTNDIESGLQRFEEIELTEHALGSMVHQALFHKTNMIRLSGNYNEAQAMYQSLISSIKNNGALEQLFIKVQRQYADLKFLQGDFKTALFLLEELLEIPTIDLTERAETYRIIGHIYRFNWFFEKALEYYTKASEIAEKKELLGVESKLYTNLIETLSWYKPEKALMYEEKAIELHTLLESKIELGKTFSALAIAYRKIDDEKAQVYASKSIEIQQAAGYQSGILFGYVAKTVLAFQQNNVEEIELYGEKIQNLSKELNVYAHLQLPLFIRENKQTEAEEIIQANEYLNSERTWREMERYF